MVIAMHRLLERARHRNGRGRCAVRAEEGFIDDELVATRALPRVKTTGRALGKTIDRSARPRSARP